MLNPDSAEFHFFCCTETVFLEHVLLLHGHTSYIHVYSFYHNLLNFQIHKFVLSLI